jgi:hypothetical protein
MMARRLGNLSVVLGWVLVTSTVFGQTQKGSETKRERSSGVRVTDIDRDHWEAVFEDDLLSGDGFGADAPIIRVRPVSTFGYLIRPRTHFVPEMLKSVEKI